MTKMSTLATCFLLVASVAMAMSAQEILDAADDAASDALALASEIDACVDGDCAEASSLVSELESLEAEHDSLSGELTQISPCSSCPTVAAALTSLDGDLVDMRVEVATWDE